jgi:signal transduction histidine kinase
MSPLEGALEQEHILDPSIIDGTRLYDVLRPFTFDLENVGRQGFDDVSGQYLLGTVSAYEYTLAAHGINIDVHRLWHQFIDDSMTVRVESDMVVRKLTENKVEWLLYEKFVEYVRCDLEEKLGKPIHPSFFAFEVGTYGLVTDADAALKSAILPIASLPFVRSFTGLTKGVHAMEVILQQGDKENAKRNKVTETKYIGEQESYGNRRVFRFLRRQVPDKIATLDARFAEHINDPQERQRYIRAICNRDMATSCGIYGMGLLVGSNITSIKPVSGDMLSEEGMYVDIRVETARGPLMTRILEGAIHLRAAIGLYRRQATTYTQLHIDSHMQSARQVISREREGVLNVQLEEANRQLEIAKEREKRDAAVVARADATLSGIADLRHLVGLVQHEMNSVGKRMATALETVSFDEDASFQRVKESADPRYHGRHRVIIKEVANLTEGERYNHYQIKMRALNQDLGQVGLEQIQAERKPSLERYIENYLRGVASASRNIVRDAVTRAQKDPFDTEAYGRLLPHLEMLEGVLVVMEEEVGELFERIGEMPETITSQPFTDKNDLDLVDIVQKVQEKYPGVTIHTYLDGSEEAEANEKITIYAIENIVRNAYEAITARASVDADFDQDAQAIAIWYGKLEGMLYIANTGPEITREARNNLFVAGKGPKKTKRSKSMGLALIRKFLVTQRGDIVCFEEDAVREIAQRYNTVLGGEQESYKTIFGIQFDQTEQ